MPPSKKNLLELSSWNHDHRKAKRDLNQNGNGKKKSSLIFMWRNTVDSVIIIASKGLHTQD